MEIVVPAALAGIIVIYALHKGAKMAAKLLPRKGKGFVIPQGAAQPGTAYRIIPRKKGKRYPTIVDPKDLDPGIDVRIDPDD